MLVKKKPFTLLEIIIVIFLITLITGAIGYNMKGALDKGKVFRTEQAIEQLQDLFLMCVAEGESPDTIVKHPAEILEKYGLAKSPKKVVQDGWGAPFRIGVTRDKSSFLISSQNLDKYRKKVGIASQDEDEESF